jgi:EF hand
MKTSALRAIVATVLGLTLAGVAFARRAPTFEQVDLNKDGMISAKEAAAKVPDLDFAAADTNHDGSLSRAEYEAALG